MRVEGDIAKALAAAADALGEIDVLVNNTARSLVKPAVERAGEWDDVASTTSRGGFMARAYAARCIARKTARHREYRLDARP